MHAITPRMKILAWSIALSAQAVALTGCDDEAEIDEVPEVAEVDVDAVAVPVGPDSVAIAAQIELEETFPLDADDVGKIIVATGTVVGTPLPVGFFLRTEGLQVIFVETTVPVAKGDRVRVVGPLTRATVAVFDGWEHDALEGQVEAEWDVQETWYIPATSVTRI